MVEEIKAKVSKTLAKNFKKRAMEIYGPKKGRHKSSTRRRYDAFRHLS